MSKRKSNNNSTLIDILSIILDGIMVDYPIDKIEKELYKKKRFDRHTVATAYSWIYDKMISNLEKINRGEIVSTSSRFLSQEEIDYIGLDNYNRLLKLSATGLLTPADIDTIMKSVELIPQESISHEEMNYIVLASLFELNRITPPGSRLLLYLSDKIN